MEISDAPRPPAAPSPVRRRRTALRAALLSLVVAASATIAAVGTPPSPDAVASEPGHLVLLDDFDGRVSASLREQGPWHVNVPGAADGALASDAVPTDFSGKTLLNDLGGQGGPVRYRGNAYASLGDLAVPAGGSGTVFFELSTDGLAGTRLHLGLSADDSPGLGMDTTGDPLDLDDFGPQLSVAPQGLVVRDGARSHRLVGLPIEDRVRYKIWLVVDNAAHVFSVRAAAGDATPVTLTSTSGASTFAFRSSPDAALTTFLHLNDPVQVPTVDTYLDSLHVAPDGTDLEDPSPRLTVINTFDHLRAGPIDGQSEWTATSGAAVTKGPRSVDGRVLTLASGTQRATRPLPRLAPGGTVFFRMRREGAVTATLGVGDAAAPDGPEALRLQTGAVATRSGDQVVADGAGRSTVGRWADRQWRCVWLVGDESGTRFTAYGRGGDLRVTTRLRAGTRDVFDVPSASADGVLDEFLALGTASRGTVQIDDLAVDTAQRDLRTPPGATCPHTGPGPVREPAPARAQAARLQLSLTTVAQLPPAAAGSPARRANAVVAMGTTSGRLAVPTLEGEVRVLRGGRQSSYLDVRDVFPSFVAAPGLGTGLGYVTFAPDFDRTGRFYTVHTEAGEALTTRQPTLDSPADTRVHGVITEWTADDPTSDVFVGRHREVLRIGFSRFTHGIQQIDFDPTARPGDADYGLLYIATGDGDETPYFSGRPGDLTAPQGKLLRIDPRETASGAAYSVPRGNPFVGRTGALPEVFASGLRNPHRFTWDTATGRMLVTNIGEKRIDSVYEVRAGADYGWNRREGAFVFHTADPTNVYPAPTRDTSGITRPLLQVGRHAGKALVGAGTYRGRLTALRGHYLFGDIVSGSIRETGSGLLAQDLPEAAFHAVALVVDGRSTTLSALARPRVDLRFGRDRAGELYVISKGLGRVWKVTAAKRLTASRPTCGAGRSTARPVGARAWQPLRPANWRFTGDEAVQLRAGSPSRDVARPAEFALVRGVRAGSFELRAEVRVDRPRPVRERDVVLVLGYRSRTHMSYVHLSDDNTAYAHNGIFVVDGSDRRRVDDQYDVRGARPAIRDRNWHEVRLVYCAAQRRAWVFMDGSSTPLLTASDDRFATGQVGFGSFNDWGRIRDVRIRYTPVS